MDQANVIRKIREHLERDGYDVWASPDGYGAGPDIFATKNDDEFLIEANGETRTRNRSGQDITIALGTIVKRMKEGATATMYGIAMARSFLRFFREYEVGGLRALNIHLFVVHEYGFVSHLNPEKTIDLVQKIKTGEDVFPL